MNCILIERRNSRDASDDGTSPTTGVKILESQSVERMFPNQIPEFPNVGRRGIPAAEPGRTNRIPKLYPIPGNGSQGWGLTFMLTRGQRGRSDGTG
jgi:hypothetical protein